LRNFAHPSIPPSSFITGESGAVFAQRIHNASDRPWGAFAVECAVFPATLLGIELFGYEEGAFSDSRKGGKSELVEAAHTGTVLLDEVGIIAATHCNLRTHIEDVEDKRFREALFFRLNILRLEGPPLRERSTDIPIIVSGRLRSAQSRRRMKTDALLPHGLAFRRPGKIRELDNIPERASLSALSAGREGHRWIR